MSECLHNVEAILKASGSWLNRIVKVIALLARPLRSVTGHNA